MSTTTRELADLMTRVAGRDRAAFAAVYRATSAKLYGIIVRILIRRDLADEVLQETYVKIWERASDFDPARASPITWMAAIARNRALDEVRRVRPKSLEDAPEALNIADPGELQLARLERSGELQRLAECLDGLAPERQQMVRLAYLDGLSREALAARFGQPVGTVKTWLHRSLKQLKDCLGQ